MADEIVVINVPGPGDPSVVQVVRPGDGVVVVPDGIGVQDLIDASIAALPLAYRHEQAIPSSVWLVPHDLPFPPSGVEVRDHLGNPHHPIVTWPSASTVQLAFGYDVRGTARLS